MHLEVFRQRPDIDGVVHAHPPITVALSIAGVSLADCMLPEVIVNLGLVPTTEYATPASEENVRAIRDLIVKHDGIILQRHGTLTVGRTPWEAYMRLESLEHVARITLILQHNSMDTEEKMGNSIKLTNRSLIEEDLKCYREKALDHRQKLRFRDWKVMTPGLSGWDLYVPQ